MDLTFAEEEDTDKVVQPDMFVMCGDYKGDKRIIGVPVLAVEVLSPSSTRHDGVRKFTLYQRVGVKEYWIVDPVNPQVDVHIHDGSRYARRLSYYKGDTAESVALPDLRVDLGVVFAGIGEEEGGANGGGPAPADAEGGADAT